MERSEAKLNKLKTLKQFCLNYNPFEDQLDKFHIELLEEFNIHVNKEDPFTITNKLLRLIDEVDQQTLTQ